MDFGLMVQGTAAPGFEETVKNALLQLAREAIQQPGTIRYDFFQFQDEPARFMLIAVWENAEQWRAHVESDVHVRYEQSLPQGAWASRPAATKLYALET